MDWVGLSVYGSLVFLNGICAYYQLRVISGFNSKRGPFDTVLLCAIGMGALITPISFFFSGVVALRWWYIMTTIPCIFFLRPKKVVAPIILGVISNAVVLAVNGFRMPVEGIAFNEDRFHTVMTASTRLSWLGDRINVFGRIASIGDLLIFFGMIFLLFCHAWYRWSHRAER